LACRRVNEIVLGKRAVTADTDLRLARYFDLSEGFFLGLQADYDPTERRRRIAAALRAHPSAGGVRAGLTPAASCAGCR
jgi:plasmid maintenance system antidote protein VapI